MTRRLRALLAGLWLTLALALAAPAAAAPKEQVLILLRMAAAHFQPNASYGGGYGDGASQAARRRVAARLARTYGLTLATGWPMPVLGVDCYVLDVPANRSPDEMVALLSRDPDVAWSQPMHTFRAQGAPNDPLFRLQPAAKAWRLADLRQMATGRNVRVAVVDSRVDLAHPDLAGQVQVARDFLPGHPGPAERHGTGVAGVIAARADNREGIAGVAPGARLMALRACWQEAASDTLCDTLSLAMAISFAIDHGAQVINLSLAGPPDLLLGKLIDAAIVHGAVVVGAADPKLAQGGFPASHPGVVAVADNGPAPPGGFIAPGRDVPTTQPGGQWSLVNGSSYAAAHVSGLFALVRERSPRPARLVTFGGGVIDACATLLKVSAPCAGCGCARQARLP